ncbi:hypothetical protein TKK_0017857 [Trichogramma kaykai]
MFTRRASKVAAHNSSLGIVCTLVGASFVLATISEDKPPGVTAYSAAAQARFEALAKACRCQGLYSDVPSHLLTRTLPTSGRVERNSLHRCPSVADTGESQSKPSKQTSWSRILATTSVGASHPIGSKVREMSDSVERLLTVLDSGWGLNWKVKLSGLGSHLSPSVDTASSIFSATNS